MDHIAGFPHMEGLLLHLALNWLEATLYDSDYKL